MAVGLLGLQAVTVWLQIFVSNLLFIKKPPKGGFFIWVC
jgi:hypothetical protein